MEFLKERSAFRSVSKERVKLLNNKIERAKEKVKLSIDFLLCFIWFSALFEFVRIEFIGVFVDEWNI